MVRSTKVLSAVLDRAMWSEQRVCPGHLRLWLFEVALFGSSDFVFRYRLAFGVHLGAAFTDLSALGRDIAGEVNVLAATVAIGGVLGRRSSAVTKTREIDGCSERCTRGVVEVEHTGLGLWIMT